MNKNGENGDSNDWILSLVKKERLKDIGTKYNTKNHRRIKNPTTRKGGKREKAGVRKVDIAYSQKSTERTDVKMQGNATVTKKRLEYLSKIVEERISTLKKNNDRWKKPYVPKTMISSSRKRKRDTSEVIVQPRPSDYGGIGLARPSLWIPLHDPSIVPLIVEEFSEHIPGFYGKQRTKAMKKQLDAKLIWRQMNNKAHKDKLLSRVVDGKRLSDMNPDDRVLAMIKAGIV